jgi:hypothetical protein
MITKQIAIQLLSMSFSLNHDNKMFQIIFILFMQSLILMKGKYLLIKLDEKGNQLKEILNVYTV